MISHWIKAVLHRNISNILNKVHLLQEMVIVYDGPFRRLRFLAH